jgi:hypothetical protein
MNDFVDPADPDEQEMFEGHTVTFTHDEWVNNRTSTAFGMIKSVPTKKAKTPGVKAVLIRSASFTKAKKMMRQLGALQPPADLPEIVSATIDICAANPDRYLPLITDHILKERLHQLDVARAALESMTAILKASDSSNPPDPATK